LSIIINMGIYRGETSHYFIHEKENLLKNFKLKKYIKLVFS